MPCGSSKVTSGSKDASNDNGSCAFEDLDHSILQYPLYTGIRNVKQILKCLQDATKEVKDIILNECNIIYECKVCANLFRSLANLLYHKRCYCKKHLCEEMVLFEHFEEEQPEVVQPESSHEKGSTPKLLKCTVDLVKTDLGNEKSVIVVENECKVEDEVKQTTPANKVNKSKEQVNKKASEIKKTENSMISRRTRDKNSQKVEKKMKLDTVRSNKSPTKDAKVDEFQTMEVDLEEAKEQNVPDEVELPDDKTETKTMEIDLEVVKELDVSDKIKLPNDKTETKIKNTENINEKHRIEEKKDIKENIHQKQGDEVCQSNDSNLKTVLQNDLPENKQTETKTDDKPKIILEPTKKIFFAKPKTIQLKNSLVLDNIHQNSKTESVGLTKITNVAGKKFHCFPKLILKTVEGSPHAVFQKSEEKNSGIPVIKKVTEQKSENEKLILVLKKDVLTPAKPFQIKSEETDFKADMKPTEFHHLTRRKRLMARNDCNVHELKCLTCNTIFTSLKTLYFHMLSIHSKKRLYYPCPLCKAYFVQIYGVTRHLVSIHNKTKDQINKLRDSIKKKSIWKKVEDVNSSKTCSISNDEKRANEPKPEIKTEENSSEIGSPETQGIKTVIKLSKNVNLHQCSKCGRIFGRKSSQVSHEKFCIMNAIKVETVDSAYQSPPTSPPLVSLLSLNQNKQSIESQINKQIQSFKLQADPDVKVSIRPKRKAEKLMHKDFIDSQTLKWRSVNRVINTPKTVSPPKKSPAKNLEKKISNIMNVDSLTCLKCGKNFSSFSNLKRHVAIHVGWTRFRCVICEYQAYNKSQCWFHIQKVHDVSEEEVEKYVQNLGSNWLAKKPISSHQSHSPLKNNSTGNEKQILKKQHSVQNIKITKKKNIGRPTGKKTQFVKKISLESRKDIDSKNEKYSSMDGKNSANNKKERAQNSESRKETGEQKKDRIQSFDFKKETSDVKKEKCQFLSPFQKSDVPDFKKDHSNYKSLTTNNPTTIILSKKLPSSSVQSVVTIPTESQSSNLANKTFPLRSSPRKVEIKSIKSPEEKSLTSLVTRSAAYSKGSIQIKITPPKPNSTENIKKPIIQYSEKTSPKKDKLISEWFPKKDLNSNTSRRESAPLIIGLVPASSSGSTFPTKNPAITYEKSNN